MPVRAWEPGGFPALTTDLYQLTMTQAYYAEGLTGEAVFDLFVRRLPPSRNYLVACGLESILDLLENVRFESGDLEYLSGLGRFTPEFVAKLADFRFEGDVYAMPEGTVFFSNEPVIEVVAPLPQAQLVETYLLNQLTFQSAVASKCARVVEAAGDRQVVDFGLRRVHGAEAGISAARAFYVAGASGTSNVMAGRLFGIPVAGTMAHSYITAHGDELAAFRAFTERNAETVLLVDTYDTLEGVKNVVRLARELGCDFNVSAIRLDSGDIGELAKRSRAILDEAGLSGVAIFASGGLDEHEIDSLLRNGAPIDGFGVGTKMGVSADAPYLDTVYKLAAYEGEGRMKLSTDKETLPYRKQVFREYDGGTLKSDTIGLHDERLPGRPLLKQVMEQGRHTDAGRDHLEAARRRANSQIEALPEYLRGLAPAGRPYEVSVSERLAAETEALRLSLE
ncbi:MAG: nicotinate phosphoribosyltransferase [Chloroflexi bacterium]|nr:nicotinate phosphoribosyltransferase [Chloroflexota bacterium]MCY3936852.1 nicotinate phosphoribosyltransferase [Chloroflexota bacterium]